MSAIDDRYLEAPLHAADGTGHRMSLARQIFTTLVGGSSLALLCILSAPVSHVTPSALVARFSGHRLHPAMRASGTRYGRPAVPRHGTFVRSSELVQATRSKQAASDTAVDDTVDLIDTLCEIDTGIGCGEEVTASVGVDVELGQGMQPLPTAFELGNPENKIEQISAELPLGVVFEQNDDGQVVVVGIDQSANAYSAGLRIGDVLRATTCVVQKKGATFMYWDLGVGGTGLQKALFTVDGASFAKVMGEIRSNEKFDQKVTLVVERSASTGATEATASAAA
eukprot:gnl/TRDRNA2_/TRDRNA2_135091_c0_seq1.p1 gnl/TRDRNA2_/TRDRNA2_135091_c0~~gnl/TRDRNA2_/TRDRNA2_135091_c0_seq1.p1  ORF type:complete len:282 (+),score=53.43 gnl/TRDRNA2_/TRDRNA2_135091_c0_seq1:74-919(+)